jgi:two-component system, chemotaxis family, protein-glutamate methylesterase/glutaminase
MRRGPIVRPDERVDAASDGVREPFLELQVVALVASAGGLRALSTVLQTLPVEFPAAVVVVQHMDPHHRSMLPEILEKRTTLQVRKAEEGSVLEPGVVYIAPPDRHLVVNPEGTLSLTQSEPVHFLRPSGDLLLESVAAACGARAIAVVLTGTGSDGSEGARAIKKQGGIVVVQDRDTAEYSGMPASAVKTGCADLELPLDGVADALVDLVMGGRSQ